MSGNETVGVDGGESGRSVRGKSAYVVRPRHCLDRIFGQYLEFVAVFHGNAHIRQAQRLRHRLGNRRQHSIRGHGRLEALPEPRQHRHRVISLAVHQPVDTSLQPGAQGLNRTATKMVVATATATPYWVPTKRPNAPTPSA